MKVNRKNYIVFLYIKCINIRLLLGIYMNEVVWVGWEIKFLILKFKLIMDLLGGGGLKFLLII